MANIILFTDRVPTDEAINSISNNLERYGRPAGAYKVASILRQNGYSVLVVPNCLRLTFKGVKEFIENNSKDLIYVGLSTTFTAGKVANVEDYRTLWVSSDDNTLNLTDVYKNIASDSEEDVPTSLLWSEGELRLISEWLDQNYSAKLVLGGAWVTTIKNGAMDIKKAGVHIITGQNEDYIVEFTNALRDGNDIPFPFGKEGQADFKDSTIDYTETDMLSDDEWLPLEIARGCAFKCAYCTYDHKGKADTTKHSKTLRDEILRNYEHYGITRYHLLDDLYNDSEEKVKRLYDEVWGNLPFDPEWISYLRLDMIWHKPETAKYLEASGCKLGAFGIETFHTKAGAKVGKGLGKERIMETLELLHETWGNRLLINALMIAGLPWEPYEHIEETMSWLKTTDLVFNYQYVPLGITRPDHMDLVVVKNDMSLDHKKYEISWTDQGWINNAGVTQQQAIELCVKDDLERQKLNVYPVDLSEYAELRSHGYTHDQLADKAFHPQIISDVRQGRYRIPELITEKFHKIISVKGK